MLTSLQRLVLGGAVPAHAPLAAIAGSASQLLPRCWAGFSTQPQPQQQQQQQQPQQPPPLQDLTPEQQQHLNVLQFLVRRPLDTARNAAMLAGLAAGYRDLFVVMDLLHKKDVLGIPHPLLDDPPAAAATNSATSSMQQDGQQQQQQQEKDGGAAEGVSQANRTQMFYPQRDFTLLPDQLPPEGGWLRSHLSEQYMTRITAYAQLLPNHLEVSYQTSTQICLWPPMESFYPALFDIDGMLRHLKPAFKRCRTKRPSNAHRVRCRLGWQRRKPYHRQPGLLR